MNDVAIRLKNVAKFYKLYNSSRDRITEVLHPFGKKYHYEFYALKDIDLEIKKGEIVGIVGKNGSGKSTLLKLITGILKHNAGSIEVNGKISAMLELGGGFYPEYTGIQNILFLSTIQGVSKKRIEKQLQRIIEFADIGEYINQPVKTYSSGMKARLGFAIAVHIDPEILILDEVIAVGDELFKRKCYAKMEEFFKGGKTIIYVSHNASSIIELCTRAIFLNASHIVLESDAKTVITYYQKYIFAQKDNKQNVLDEIKLLNAKNSNIGSKAERSNNQKELKVNYNEYFIPEFKPKTTVEYKNYEVGIRDACIKTISNEIVNILQINKKYYFGAKIIFGINARNVAFSFAIKNEKGMDISSYKTLSHDYIDVIKGAIYEVKWEFTNKLLPGTYYLNIGIRSHPENKESFVLNRIIDVLVFKIQNNRVSSYGGILSLDQKMSITKM